MYDELKVTDTPAEKPYVEEKDRVAKKVVTDAESPVVGAADKGGEPQTVAQKKIKSKASGPVESETDTTADPDAPGYKA